MLGMRFFLGGGWVFKLFLVQDFVGFGFDGFLGFNEFGVLRFGIRFVFALS